MYRKKGTAVYYNCPGHSQWKGCGNSRHYNEKQIEQYLLDHIDGKIAALMQSHQRASTSNKPKRDTIKRKLSRLSELYVEEMISKEDYKRQYQDLTTELENIPDDAVPVDIEAIKRNFFENWKDIYADLSREGKQIFWRSTIKAIYLSADSVRDFDLS